MSKKYLAKGGETEMINIIKWKAAEMFGLVAMALDLMVDTMHPPPCVAPVLHQSIRTAIRRLLFLRLLQHRAVALL